MTTPSSTPTRAATNRLAATLALGILVAACAGAGPTGTPTPSPTPDDTIAHATGAKDVVLRFREGGGFVPIDFFATEAPGFTLYGDGTVLFRDATVPAPTLDGGAIAGQPFLVAQLDEDQIQELLRLALPSLSAAKQFYDAGNMADVPAATFTITVAGQTKEVTVVGLGFEREPGPDTAILASLADLGERFRAFSAHVAGERAWVPERYRAMLIGDGAQNGKAWPWSDLTTAGFTEDPDPAGVRFPSRVMTPAEVDAVGVRPFDGGYTGVGLTAPDGRIHTFAVRPLLPDEDR